uniref:Uncharacterized protein n=1 Tax=Triticum urartu TaxID=4572 RepID=A0A8R7THY7_TRIUA
MPCMLGLVHIRPSDHSCVAPRGEHGHVSDGNGGRPRRRRPGTQRRQSAHQLRGRRRCRGRLLRRLGEEHRQATAPVWALLAGVAQARHQRRCARHRHVHARAVAALRGVAVHGDQVVQRREGLARGHDVLVSVLAAAAGVRPRSRHGHQGRGGAVVGGGEGQGRGVGVLVAPGELAREERVAGHDLVDVVAGDVEVGDGVESPELDGGDVVRLRGLLLGACNHARPSLKRTTYTQLLHNAHACKNNWIWNDLKSGQL